MDASECIKFAPLSAPFLAHLREHWLRIPTPPKLTEEALAQAQRQLEQSRADLWSAFLDTRQQVVTDLAPLVQAKRLTMKELRGQIKARSDHDLAASTLRAWVSRHLLTRASSGKPEPSCAAAILIMRSLMPRERQRDWLPSAMASDEPRWWCWRQDAPDAQLLPCPVPMPSDLPTAALLWTPWVGAAWQEPWQAIEGGAARWAGVPTLAEINQWGITLETMPADDAASVVLRIATQRLLCRPPH